MDIGHALISDSGELVSVDATLCEILRMPEPSLRGRRVLDLTAPADRSECAEAIQALRETRRPFVIVKRLMRDDGSLVWVRNSVAITVESEREAGTIMARVEPVMPNGDRSPAALLDAARLQIEMLRERDMVCDPTFLSDPGWATILAVYVAEAEGRAIDVDRLSILLGKPKAISIRWIRALLAAGILDIEFRNPAPDTAKAFRLSCSTHERLEEYLGRTRSRP